MLQALNILEDFNLREMGHNSARYLHVVAEALKLSFADRNAYNADPKFAPPIPMKELLSKEYAAARRAQIDLNRAIELDGTNALALYNRGVVRRAAADLDGAVADFVLLHLTTTSFSFKWYVFNLADAAIVAGVAGLLYDSLAGWRAGTPQNSPDPKG